MKDLKVKVICGALVADGNSFLAVQEAKEYVKGKWNIPAGHAELDEDLFESAVREVKEETNLDIKLKGLLGIYQHRSVTGNNIVKVIFLATARNNKLKFPKKEIMNVKWMTFDEFKLLPSTKIRTQDLRTMIDDYHNRGSFDLNLIKTLGI